MKQTPSTTLNTVQPTRTPPEFEDVQQQIAARTAVNQMLEDEVSAYTLESEKYQEQILELENWIYLINALLSNPTSNKINDVDRALKLAGDLRAESQQLRRELLLEAKKQYDTRQATTMIVQKQLIENEELANEAMTNLDHAKQRMTDTLGLLKEEQEGLTRENQRLELLLKIRPICTGFLAKKEEITLLESTQKAVSAIRAAQPAE